MQFPSSDHRPEKATTNGFKRNPVNYEWRRYPLKVKSYYSIVPHSWNSLPASTDVQLVHLFTQQQQQYHQLRIATFTLSKPTVLPDKSWTFPNQFWCEYFMRRSKSFPSSSFSSPTLFIWGIVCPSSFSQFTAHNSFHHQTQGRVYNA